MASKFQLKKTHRCLVCGMVISKENLVKHKQSHPDLRGYGIMWPLLDRHSVDEKGTSIPIYESSLIARALGVRKVYVRDEGLNLSGSMKDYLVAQAVTLGLQEGFQCFTVTSSGNHAVSLAMATGKHGARAVVFTPASSNKLSLLASFSNVLTIGVRGAIFEDVYNLVSLLDFKGVYNANVSNEYLLPALVPVSKDIISLDPLPTHVLAGVGNGTYLAGIAFGFEQIGISPMPKVMPVGMKGAFPTEEAFRRHKSFWKYHEFLFGEDEICVAEGSIATESYSMPQLLHAVRLSGGLPLGGLINQDLRNAYLMLAEDRGLVEKGAIPEATGIMSLAAAIKWKNAFSPEDVLLLCFTGHGAKDTESILELLPGVEGEILAKAARRARPDLAKQEPNSIHRNPVLIDRNVSVETISAIIARGGQE